MKTITILELAEGACGFKKADMLVEAFKGRPKNFPDVLIVRRIDENDPHNYQVVKVEEAIYNGDKVEVLLDTGEVIVVDDNFTFQLWREPTIYRENGR